MSVSTTHRRPRQALIDEHLQGIVRRPPRAEPEAARQEIRLEDRLEHDLHRGLHDPVANRRNRQRPLLARRARLGDQHPPAQAAAGSGPPPARLASSPSSRVYAVLLDTGQGDLVDARRAVVPAHRDPRAPQTSLRLTLSYSAWNLRPGSALAARYSACCKARTGSPGTRTIPARRD